MKFLLPFIIPLSIFANNIENIIYFSYNKGKYQETFDILNEINLNDYKSKYYLAKSAFFINKLNYAKQIFLSLPQTPVIKANLARIYFLQGNYEEAKKLFLEALKSNPPIQVRKNILAYLYVINSKTSKWHIQLNLNAGILYDSNIKYSQTNKKQDFAHFEAAQVEGELNLFNNLWWENKIKGYTRNYIKEDSNNFIISTIYTALHYKANFHYTISFSNEKLFMQKFNKSTSTLEFYEDTNKNNIALKIGYDNNFVDTSFYSHFAKKISDNHITDIKYLFSINLHSNNNFEIFTSYDRFYKDIEYTQKQIGFNTNINSLNLKYSYTLEDDKNNFSNIHQANINFNAKFNRFISLDIGSKYYRQLNPDIIKYTIYTKFNLAF